MASAVRQHKREAAVDDAARKLPAKPLVKNASIARLLLAAMHAFADESVRKAYRKKAKPSPAATSGRPPATASKTVGGKIDMELVFDTGTNVTLLDQDYCRQEGVKVDQSRRFDIVVANGPTFVTDGVTKSAVPSVVDDTDGRTGTLAFIGQSAKLSSNGGNNRKALVNVIGDLVEHLGFIVVLMKNDSGGVGHFMVNPETAQQFPIDLNVDKLPVARRSGVTSAHPSTPLTMWAMSKLFGDLARGRDSRLAKTSTAVESVLQTAFVPHAHMAAGSAITDDDTTTSDSDSASDTDYEEAGLMRLAAMKAGRAEEWTTVQSRKRRARTLPVVHTGESAHRLLHRSADATHKTLAQAEVKVKRGSKIVDGDQTTAADFAHDSCSVCKQVKMLAPSRRASASCRECGAHLE